MIMIRSKMKSPHIPNCFSDSAIHFPLRTSKFDTKCNLDVVLFLNGFNRILSCPLIDFMICLNLDPVRSNAT